MMVVFLFLRFITTRNIESQKGTPHPPSITPPRPRGCFRNRKRKAYAIILPFSLLTPSLKTSKIVIWLLGKGRLCSGGAFFLLMVRRKAVIAPSFSLLTPSLKIQDHSLFFDGFLNTNHVKKKNNISSQR